MAGLDVPGIGTKIGGRRNGLKLGPLANYVRDTLVDGLEETIITPSPISARGMFGNLTKGGIIQAYPPEMPNTSNGPYYPSLVDMRTDSGFPADWALYYSTDHDTGDGGIYLSVCRGDPTVPANWLTYNAALAAGWFAGVANKPAGNPIFVRIGTGRQLETPCVVKVGSTYVMTYQEEAVPDYGQQGTLRAISLDGLNWSGPDTILLRKPATAVGDGHTGYFVWGLNPFPGVPYTYVGYSLCGGQGKPTFAQWGTNDPVAGSWTFITSLGYVGGRATDGIDKSKYLDWNKVDPRNIRQTPQGYSCLMDLTAISAGAAISACVVVEALLDSTGTKVIAKPQVVLPLGGAGDGDEKSVTIAGSDVYGNKRVVIYQGANAVPKNSLLVASGALRNPANSYFDPLIPAIPASLNTRQADFRSLSAIPANFTELKIGTTPPSAAFSSSGISVTLGTAANEYYLFESYGFIPNNVDFFDVYFDAYSSAQNQGNRIPYFGFAADKTLPLSSQTDAAWVDNGGGTGGTFYYHCRQGGSEPTASTESVHGGVGYGTQTTVYAQKNIGIRYFPATNRMIFLGEGGVEEQEIAQGVNLDKTKRYYAFMGFKAVSGTPVETVQRMTVRTDGPLTAPTLPDLTLSNTSFTTNDTSTDVIARVQNQTRGSTISVSPSTFTSAGTQNVVLTETLAEATNSGHQTTISVNVTAAPVLQTMSVNRTYQAGNNSAFSTYSFASVSLGAEDPNRMIVVDVISNATASTGSASIGMTLTPSGGASTGTPVAMTLIASRVCAVVAQGQRQINRYAAMIPAGTTATISAPFSAQQAKAGIEVNSVINAASITPLATVSNDTVRVGNTDSLSVTVDKKKKSATVATVELSTSGQFFTSSAYDVPSLDASGVIVTTTFNAGAVTWSGLSNPTTPGLAGSANVGGHMLMASTWQARSA